MGDHHPSSALWKVFCLELRKESEKYKNTICAIETLDVVGEIFQQVKDNSRALHNKGYFQD